MNETRKVICRMCRTTCGLDIHVQDGKIAQITGMPEHPRNTLCVKPYAIPELVNSNERLVHPLRKKDGQFREVSWDDVFDLIKDKLIDIKQRFGAKAVVTHTGNAYVGTLANKIPKLFSDVFGTPNFTTIGSMCFLTNIVAHNLTGVPLSNANHSSATKCIVLWGINPTESFPLERDTVLALTERGAKLIVIDTRRTRIAKMADIHAQVRPGSECALALGLLNVVISEGLYDTEFVKNWTVGFDELVEHVKEFTPKRVEEITWVPSEMVRDIAHMYVNNSPACLTAGVSSEESANGVQAIRALVTLIGITGNLDVAGGNVYLPPPLRQADLSVPEKVSEDTPIGAAYPLFTKYTDEQQMCRLADQILADKPYPIRALLVAGGDPILSWPNSNKVRKAFEKLEFLLVIDQFMNETAKLADIVLPSSTFVERQDIRDYRTTGASLFTVSNKAIEPIGSTMDDWKIWAELGKRMGYAEYFPWKDSDELIEYLLKPSNISMDELKRPGGLFYAERLFRKYLKDGFASPSKKLEIYSETLEKLGYDPLPTFHEPPESPVSRPDLIDDYPFIAIAGPRTVTYLGSQHRNLPSLRRIEPKPLVEINAQAADNLGIADGDLCEIESLRGKVLMEAKVTEDVPPQVVSMPKGWSQANVNCLSSDESCDPVSGYPDCRVFLCRVGKAGN